MRLTALVLLLAPAALGAQVHADSVADYSDVQGQDGWEYGYYDGDSIPAWEPADFERCAFFDVGNAGWTVDFNNYWTTVQDYWIHPNAVGAGKLPDEQWAVLRWTSDVVGLAVVHGRVRKSDPTGGDGVTMHLFIDGVESFDADLAFDDTDGDTFSIPLTLSIGTVIDAAVAPKPTINFDTSSFRVVVAAADQLALTAPFSPFVGIDQTIDCFGATPGSLVHTVAGVAPGSTPVPGCPGLVVSITTPRLLGSVVADATGLASLIVPIPAQASGLSVLLQAAEPGSCRVSNVVSVDLL